jgi:hypothetical protein
VIDLIDDVSLHELLEPLEVRDHPGFWIHGPANGHFQDVVVSVPTGVGAGAKDLGVLIV